MVNNKPAAHLIFAREGQSVSVFSLPASARVPAREGTVCTECVEGHMVAGFVRTDGVYCLVGYCAKKNLSLDEVGTLLEKHCDDLISGSVALGQARAGEQSLH
jgi:hypothetical protein